MGNATLLDVFQAAAGLTNQGLDIYSRQKKTELDAVYLESSRFNTPQLAAENWGCGGFVPPHTQRFEGEIFNTPELAPGILYFEKELELKQTMNSLSEDFYKIDPDGNNNYQTNPQLYRDHIDKTLRAWQENALQSGNNSRYYNDLVHRAQLSARTGMEQVAYKAEVEAGRQQANVALQKAYVTVFQDQTMNPSEKLNTLLAINHKSIEINYGNVESLKKMNDETYSNVLNMYLSSNIQSTTEQDRQYVEELRGYFPQDMPGRDEAIAKAVEERRNIIWTNNENALFEQDAIWRRLTTEAVQAGKVVDSVKWAQARNIYARWAPVRDSVQNSTEYDPDKKDQLLRTFIEPYVKEVAPTGGGGSGSGSRAPKIQEYYQMRVVSGNESPEAMLDAYMTDLSNWANANGVSLDDYLYSNEYLEDTREFLQTVAKDAIAQYETTTGITLKGEKGLINNAVNSAVNLLKNVPKDKAESANAYLVMAATNAFMDFGNGVFLDDGDNSLSKRLNGIAQALVVSGAFSGRQPQLRTDRQKYDFIKNLEDNGEDLAMRIRAGLSIENRGGRLVLTPGREVMAGGREFWEGAYDVLAQDAATILGIDAGKIASSASRSTEGGDKNEVSAMPTFTVAAGTRDAAGKDVGGTYRFVTQNDKLVLQRSDGQTYRQTANETRSEQRQEQNNETRRLTLVRNLGGYADSLLRGRSVDNNTKLNLIREIQQQRLSTVDILSQGVVPGSLTLIPNDSAGQINLLKNLSQSEREKVLGSWISLSNTNRERFNVRQEVRDFVHPRRSRR